MNMLSARLNLAGLLAVGCLLWGCSRVETPNPESLVFTGPADGCGSFLIYQSNEAGDLSIAVQGDRDQLGLSTEAASFSIGPSADIQLSLLSYEGNIEQYYCNDVIIIEQQPKIISEWIAQRGTARIRIVEENLGPSGQSQPLYSLSIELEDVELRNDQGTTLQLDQHQFPVTTVGWYPG
ncbi:hypothetical protein [Flavilitoribacter nigricans]|uniref:Uncharacterized protein n=1 Tax=Flavilitoribacter nigricans (strain ATCC 23147 / DSM 23189 / NBRC 102662 / NCIMB 1420 / SS-2) TaxID=1122177 RepID=A0A2D0N6G9_FLAN2|nr:hypothetical protein [Flavilitoribacter nigricans]PHN04111.1 hypothetical protein CRP01_23220 [Flavilitoribacter nigricans DSM 23189 = NBRC 102662]